MGVTGQITAPSFKVTSAIDESLVLRANGVAKALTKAEINAAVQFDIQQPVVNTELPNGNSIQLIPITFDGNGASGTRIFALLKPYSPVPIAFTPISAANLLVSVGGVIQKPDTDYTVSGSNITFPASTWPNPPTAGLSCFIIAFGGLGGLTQNQDWDGSKGVLLVGSAIDNEAIKLGVGSNNQILTADSTTSSGLAWKSPAPSVPSGSVMLFYQSTAPIGWTRIDTQNNKALRVVSGTGPTGGGQGSSTGGTSDGTTEFTSIFASRTPAGSVSVSGSNTGGGVSVSGSNTGGSVSDHTLTIAQIPSHSHGVPDGEQNIGSGGGSFDQGDRAPIRYISTQLTGGGGAHNHGFTNPSWSGSAAFTNPSWSGSGSFTGTAMDFAVQYIDVILCSKN